MEMHMRFVFLCMVFSVLCCGKKYTQKDPDPEPTRLEQLSALQQSRIARAREIRDPDNGWIAPDSCDGFLWSGKLAAVICDVDLTAAEREPGRFGRRPDPVCWSQESGDQGSKTTWSRDMGKMGMVPYAWLCRDRGILERHIDYGKANNWVMGEPIADGRVIYTPGLVGILHQVVWAMGGENSANRLWPDVYPSGLQDYEAHNQVMGIWIRGEVSRHVNDLDSLPKPPPKGTALELFSISETMYSRLVEHASREPENPLYAAVLGLYTGDLRTAVDLCLIDPAPVGSYVRIEEGMEERAYLAEVIFACSIVLRKFGHGH
jgi:hypothetical protein